MALPVRWPFPCTSCASASSPSHPININEKNINQNIDNKSNNNNNIHILTTSASNVNDHHNHCLTKPSIPTPMKQKHNPSNNEEEVLKVPSSSTKGNSSFIQATLNCISLLFGLGILSSPYAVSHAGWFGVAIAMAIGGAYAYTAHLMVKCMEQHPDSTNYQDVAKLALGRRARVFIAALFYMEITGSLIGYCISVGDNLVHLFPEAGTHLHIGLLSGQNFMIFVACACVLPTVWLRDLSALAFTSMWCVGSTLVLLVAVMLSATVTDHIGFRYSIPFLDLRGVPIAAGLYAFSFGGTGVFPSIYKSMRDPSRFNQVLILSFTIAITAVCGLGIAGASMFGPSTASQITLSMPSQFITTKVVLWMTVLTPMLKFALLLSPITTAIEAHLRQRYKTLPPPMLLFLAILMRSCALALVAIAAMVLPYFNYVVALIGSSMTIAICLFFPCLFYMTLCRHLLTRPTIALIFVLLGIGFIAGICGTLFSFRGLVESERRHLHG